MWLGASLAVAALIEFGLVSAAFDKLGLSPSSAALLFAMCLGGSYMNVPLFHLSTKLRGVTPFRHVVR
jgi:uncharacterized membrane protein